MSKVLIVGDGALAEEMFALMSESEHETQFLNEGLDISSFDFMIEAILDSPQDKADVLMDIAHQLKADTILMTATHNASVAEVASWLPKDILLVGWAALPPLRDVIELVAYHDEASKAATNLLISLHKEVVPVEDSLGGVLPRIIASLINNAAYALYENVASAEDIDAAMKLGTNYPLGPLEWADLIGLSQVIGMLDAMSARYGSQLYHPCPLLLETYYSNSRLRDS
jgi:3-hydroxybutyryl-CoA dehydrogenase